MKNHSLITTIALAAITLTCQVRAQTCQDGCFYSNTYQGDNALLNFGAGGNDTAFGSNALTNNTGTDNTALGTYALLVNTSGKSNTAVGSNALYNNDTGFNNTATGFEALASNTAGAFNTANGDAALFANNGDGNTAAGDQALQNNTIGNSNTANGFHALFSNTTGSNNVAIGVNAGQNLTTGSNNIVIGANLLGVAKEANTTRIGNSTQKKVFIGGISGKTIPNGVAVIINSNGQLGTMQSSARYKTAVKRMDKASEAILALKPVTFRYKEELDSDKIPQFGLIAEEVERVNPDLVARDEAGKAYTVRYEAVNAMLLNEFLKEHRKVEQQESMITEMKLAIARHETTNLRLQKQIELLNSGLQKVANEVELKQAAPQFVTNQ